MAVSVIPAPTQANNGNLRNPYSIAKQLNYNKSIKISPNNRGVGGAIAFLEAT